MKKYLHNSTQLFLLLALLVTNINWGQTFSLPYTQDFEGSNPTAGWTIGSSSSTTWIVGTATNNGGSKSLYVSNDGTTNTYTNSPNTAEFFYASFDIDLTSVANAQLQFDWKCVGEWGGDYGEVYIESGGVETLISSQFELYNSSTYITKTINLQSYVGGVRKIKFKWNFDQTVVNNPPLAIDNISVINLATPPNFQPPSSNSETQTSAIIVNGINSEGSNSITSRGIVYSTSNNPTLSNSVINSGSGIGNFVITLTNLQPGTTYYYRTFATTIAGTYYSSTQNFNTLNLVAPVATTASEISNTSFKANWNSVTNATGYKLDVSTSSTVFTNYRAEAPFVTFDDFVSGYGNNNSLSNSYNQNTGIYLYSSNGSMVVNSSVNNVFASAGWESGANDKCIIININAKDQYNIKLSCKLKSTLDGPKNYKLQYSLLGDNYGFIDIPGGTITCSTDYTTGVITNLLLPQEINNQPNVFLRWLLTSDTAINGNSIQPLGESYIDDIILKGGEDQTLVSGYDNLTVSGTSQTVTGLDVPVTYYYRVRATNGTTSANSNVITVTTACAPSTQPTSYIFGNDASSVSTTITFSFQAAIPSATGNLVVRYAHGATPTAPSNGTTYSVGDALGSGTVVYAGTNTSGTTSGLSPNTEYDFYTYAYNNSTNCSMVYNTTSPLSSSYKTCVIIPTLSTSSLITNTSFTANWSGVSGATSYRLYVYSNSNFTQQIVGSPFTSNTNSFNVTGLSPSTTYYYKVKGIGYNNCDSGLSSSGSVTLLCTPLTQPFTYQFGLDSTYPSSIIGFSYQPTTIASTGYLTVVYPHGSTPTVPVSGTSYSSGDSIGAGTVAYSGPNYYSYINNLSPNTEYDFYTYAYNTTQTCSLEYNLNSPLTGSYTTCVTKPTSNSATNITNTGFTANWSSVSGATSYSLEVFSDSNLNNYVTGSPFTANTNSFTVTGLTNTGTYYYRVSANGAAYCTSGASAVQGPISLECNPSTSVANTAFATATTLTTISGEFTAPLSNAPESYLVVRTTTNSQPAPVNGTTYSVGSNSIGFIEYVNTTAGTWTSTGLTANTNYYYWVFSVITNNCFNAPVYSTVTTSFSAKSNRTATWTGAVSNSWNTAGNWSTGELPNSTDNIVIDTNSPNSTLLDTNFTLAAGQKLTITNTGTLTVSPTSILSISGYADFGGRSVILKSNSSGTATLGQVTGTLEGATNVTVERYIPAKRSWRAVTAPLKGWFNSSIYSSWMNNNQSGVSDSTGMLVFGPTTNWGIQMAQNYNLLTYNSNDTWSGVSMPIASGTLFSSTINNAFMAFITGPFGSSNITSGATATTLKANGQLITGTQTYANLPSSSYSFLGNPYASPISPSSIIAANPNFSNIWVWDPQLANFGAYVVYSGSTYSNTSGSYNSGQPIQSGQAFFVKPSTTTDFIISESNKSTVVDNGLFNKTLTTPTALRINLHKQVQNEWRPFDAAIALFDADSSNSVNSEDAAKMYNSNTNLTIQNSSYSLMADHRALPVAEDVINLRISETEIGASYKLIINSEEFANMGVSAHLVDLFTNTSLQINLDGTNTEYTFVTSSDTQSSGDRFKIVFDSFLTNSSFVSNSIQVYPNPFNGNVININSGNLTVGNYKYSITNILGQVVNQGKIDFIENNSNYSISFSNSIPNGVYILKLIDDHNKEYSIKIMKQ